MSRTRAQYVSPLEWPVAVPRTDADDRKFGKFTYQSTGTNYCHRRSNSLTLAMARDRVLAELDRFLAVVHVDDASVVISTNMPARVDGSGLLANRRVPNDPGVAVFFDDDDGNRQVFACDVYTKVEQNIAAVAAVIDAMRRIERHGGENLLGAAMSGFRALPEAGGGEPWWDVIGVRRTDSFDAVKSAYRKQCMVHHPDRGNGTDGWNRLQDAWRQARDVLEPTARRAQ